MVENMHKNVIPIPCLSVCEINIEYSVDIFNMADNSEKRLLKSPFPRCMYDFSNNYFIKEDMQHIVDFFYNTSGQYESFLLQDPLSNLYISHTNTSYENFELISSDHNSNIFYFKNHHLLRLKNTLISEEDIIVTVNDVLVDKSSYDFDTDNLILTFKSSHKKGKVKIQLLYYLHVRFLKQNISIISKSPHFYQIDNLILVKE